MNLSTVKWAQWDKTQSRELLVCSYVCASHCAQLLHAILHRTDLIVFPLTLQTITTAPMMSIWIKKVSVVSCLTHCTFWLQISNSYMNRLRWSRRTFGSLLIRKDFSASVYTAGFDDSFRWLSEQQSHDKYSLIQCCKIIGLVPSSMA